MFKNILSGVENLEVLPIFVLLMFFTFFTLIVVRTFMLRKEDVNDAANIPLNDNKVINQRGE
ncbi:MAG: cbb3-type cytochrome c oxidase subunit 3 [Candidatus Kapaibacterium sp.]